MLSFQVFQTLDTPFKCLKPQTREFQTFIARFFFQAPSCLNRISDTLRHQTVRNFTSAINVA